MLCVWDSDQQERQQQRPYNSDEENIVLPAFIPSFLISSSPICVYASPVTLGKISASALGLSLSLSLSCIICLLKAVSSRTECQPNFRTLITRDSIAEGKRTTWTNMSLDTAAVIYTHTLEQLCFLWKEREASMKNCHSTPTGESICEQEEIMEPSKLWPCLILSIWCGRIFATSFIHTLQMLARPDLDTQGLRLLAYRPILKPTVNHVCKRPLCRSMAVCKARPASSFSSQRCLTRI